jgi:mono/diheme cytochrome c family protein
LVEIIIIKMRPWVLFFSWLGIGIFISLLVGNNFPMVPAQQALPTPTLDRLALPVLSEHPSQVETGSSIYYYHCMPCHGDQGQGLTDEWRAVWEEDHQDCWASGCHSIRDADKTFTIPTVIPPVIGNTALENRFSTPEKLFEYLKETHPPQSPGILKDDEYWALTAYLLAKNGVIPPQGEAGPLAKRHTSLLSLASMAVIAAVGIVLIFGLILKRNYRLKREAKDP